MNSVLIIERDRSVLKTICGLLDSLHIDHDTLRSWAPGVIPSWLSGYRAVLVSVETPQLEIEDLVKAVEALEQQQKCSISIILMTQPRSEKLLQECRKHRHKAVLNKPVACDSLFRTLSNFSDLRFDYPISEKNLRMAAWHRQFAEEYQHWFTALEQISQVQSVLSERNKRDASRQN